MTMHLQGDSAPSVLASVTDLELSGRIAQVGRGGIIAPIASRLLGELPRCVEIRLVAPGHASGVANPVGLRRGISFAPPGTPTGPR